MTWVNLDDQMAEHPKVDGLSDGAFRLHISGIFYCNRYLTDGIIAVDKITRLMPKFKPSYVTELVQRLVWVELDAGRAYEIHDYLDWNKSRAEVEKRRKASSDGGQKGARRRWGHD